MTPMSRHRAWSVLYGTVRNPLQLELVGARRALHELSSAFGDGATAPQALSKYSSMAVRRTSPMNGR
jgi:hypothetical protein